MEYFASLKSEPGLNTPPYNPCTLLDSSLLVLPAGEQFESQTGEREVLAVILGGTATFEVAGQRFERVGGRPNVFTGKPHALYLPAGVAIRSMPRARSRSPSPARQAIWMESLT